MARQHIPATKAGIDVPEGFTLPPKTQWAYTPALWDGSAHDIAGNILTTTELAENIEIHHDGEGDIFAIRPPSEGSGLNFEFDDFKGSFISIVFTLPRDVAKLLGRHDLLRISLKSSATESFKAFARLNLRHGPNSEQATRMIDIGEGDIFTEFDIFYMDIEANRVSKAWIDIIINEPAGRKFGLSDVVILSRVRASL